MAAEGGSSAGQWVYAPESGHSGGATVNGKYVLFSPGDVLDFGPEDMDERSRGRCGAAFVPRSEYTGRLRDYTGTGDGQKETPAPDTHVGPAWTRVTVGELVGYCEGTHALSKQGLVTLCELQGIEAEGTAKELGEALMALLDDEAA